jgi:hypothetical protein
VTAGDMLDAKKLSNDAVSREDFECPGHATKVF